MQRRFNPVFRSLNRPLTVMGVERKLFFLALLMGAAVFNLLHTFLGGILMFFLLYWFARWATRTDPQILRFMMNSTRLRTGRLNACCNSTHQQLTAFGLFPEWFRRQSAHGGKVGVLRCPHEIINGWSSLP